MNFERVPSAFYSSPTPSSAWLMREGVTSASPKARENKRVRHDRISIDSKGASSCSDANRRRSSPLVPSQQNRRGIFEPEATFPLDQSPPQSFPFVRSTFPSRTRRRAGTVLLDDRHQDLFLFRDEAEYSDYFSAIVTGVHALRESVVYYEVEVHLSQRKWKLYRRFSEFRALRQALLKHFTKHQKTAPTARCAICAELLQTIQQDRFPSRHRHRAWKSLFPSSSSSPGSPAMPSSPLAPLPPRVSKHQDATAALIADRTIKFQDFVAVCLRTLRGLRQHGRIFSDNSACDISTCLRLLEEFFGLSFTRYLGFLSERGVVETDPQRLHPQQQQQNQTPLFPRSSSKDEYS